MSQPANRPAILCDNIGKRYRLGEQQPYRALRDYLTDALSAPYRLLKKTVSGAPASAKAPALLWALRGVSLTIQPGEVLGVIGRNGSGKTTLLKILSRITKPTEGRAEIRGRVGALLEVGTGFHPELTGRENIYLNGAILGMRKSEIDRKFDEIVDFSECGQFLDTQVKHYSSGMHMRLAFSVAAHLDTEILFVDEVLAVGDVAFQKKCLGRMGEVAHQGRTVIMVSHNTVAVEALCTRVICLQQGSVRADGKPKEVTSEYLRSLSMSSANVFCGEEMSGPGSESVRLRRVSIRPLDGRPEDSITVRTPILVEFEYWKLSTKFNLDLLVHVFNERNILVFTTACFGQPTSKPLLLRSSFIIPGDFLNNGLHKIELGFHRDRWDLLAYFNDLVAFDVMDSPELRQMFHDDWDGAVRPNLNWTTVELSSDLPQ